MPDAAIIDGRAEAARLRQRLAAAASELRAQHGVTPGLAAILVGDDPSSQIYLRNKTRACAEVGLTAIRRDLPETASEADVLAVIEQLNADTRVDGILVQLPLPSHLDPTRIIASIDPGKDVDGFHPINIGRLWSGDPLGLVPCTPQGCLMLIRTVHRDLSGVEALVLGRSLTVGRPMAALLLTANCTVTVAHSRSHDLAALCRCADILVAAVGRPQLVKADWIKPGATIIDVGISRVAAGDAGVRLVGDVDFAAVRAIAGAITPVPGGVGPMTIACLLRNTVLAACRCRGLSVPEALST